ncbi:MAG: efflux transporter outer membrane subunit [Planctomycetes bacterium]|nr:efflux transporter outer membrane subunit [Planctomycetota bacterium]
MALRGALARSLWTLLVAGCTVGPDFRPPERVMPAAWRQPRVAGLSDAPPTDADWWKTFGDPLLTRLVDQALAQNLDLRAQLARLSAARALRGVAAADGWPSVDGRANYEDRRESRNTPFGAFIPRTSIHTVAADAVWELDLWGRVRRGVEAAERDLGAREADLAGARLSVAAEVVSTYVDLRAAQRRLRIAQANLSLQQQTLTLVRSRLNAGLVAERDVAQAATNVESTRARLPTLETAALQAQHRLAVLLGRAPAELPSTLNEPGELPRLPVSVAVGVPADLLRRRPDVRAAEWRLAAEVARIGVAEAERYPRLSLGGTLGLSANALKDVFTDGSDLSVFGPSLRWNLFDGGRLRNRIRSLEASAEAAQIDWERTVLLALEEAENAFVRFVREQARRTALGRAAAQAARAVELARTQYRTGLTDFQAVIDSERTVATVQDELVGSDAAVATSMVAIFKALGGGVVQGPDDKKVRADAPAPDRAKR